LSFDEGEIAMTTQTTTRYRADQIGSLLRPQALLDARAAHRAGELNAAALRSAEDRAILDVLAMQEEVGLGVVTDGDFRHETFMSVLPDAVDGFVSDRVMSTWKDADGHVQTESRATTLVVGGRLRSRRRLTADSASFLAKHAQRPYKVTLPSPALFYGESFKPGVTDRVYADRSALLADVVQIVRDEAAALVNDGVPYIQLDNPRYTRLIDQTAREEFRASGIDPDRELDEMIGADNACVDGLDRTDRVFGIHLCRGNSRSRWNYEGSYEEIAERIFHTLAFDTLLLEYDDDRSGGFEPLRFVPHDKVVVLGLITTKQPRLERREDLVRRIEEAAQYVPLERLALSPQCGFASTTAGNRLTADDQRRKLELLVETADQVWGR
jgi:5-methyltetrahydropteroyltriglutamate--homocysteine methyltransferase